MSCITYDQDKQKGLFWEGSSSKYWHRTWSDRFAGQGVEEGEEPPVHPGGGVGEEGAGPGAPKGGEEEEGVGPGAPKDEDQEGVAEAVVPLPSYNLYPYTQCNVK